jgi:hypothetical protein
VVESWDVRTVFAMAFCVKNVEEGFVAAAVVGTVR